jgi:hypothetical protein
MKMYLGLVAEGPKVQPAGKIAEVGAKAGEILLGAVGKLSGAVNNLDAIITHLRLRLKFNKGTLGVGGEYFRDFGAGTLVELHGMEAVMTPKQVQELLQNAQAGVMKGLAAATSTDPADSAISAESAKMSETVTSTLSTLATQITNSNQMQIGKLEELISTMRDKTIWEDMLRAMEDNADYSKRIADNIA